DVAMSEYGVCFQRYVPGMYEHRHTTKSQRKTQFHALTPERASKVRSMRLSPSSRPPQSNHSCSVCAPPPEPPPPMAIASRPSDRGMLASVEARCTCAAFPRCRSTARITSRMRDPAGNSPPGRFPITTISALRPGSHLGPELRASSARDSSSPARCIAIRMAYSSPSISRDEVERISTRMLADSGMELTEVPPRMTPMLQVVLGEVGTGTWANPATARARATMGLGAPKSLHE